MSESKTTHSLKQWDETVDLFIGQSSNNLFFSKMTILLTPPEFDQIARMRTPHSTVACAKPNGDGKKDRKGKTE